METQSTHKQDTGARILKTALKLFQQRGFEETTMRQIAEQASVAVGAAYYYFRGKDDLVLAFYAQTGEEAFRHNQETLAQTQDFEKRFRDIIEFKLHQLRSYRSLVRVLARNAVEIDNLLSPFSPQTRELRDRSIDLIREAISGSDLKVSHSLLPALPKLLWMFQMGVILLWSVDPSEEQVQTHRITSQALHLLLRLLRLSRLPFMGALNDRLIQLVQLVEQIAGQTPKGSPSGAK
ncbi:MAG: TetR/AcrR family transcriptional regulator [Acidobacteriota bacterium]